MLHRGAGAVRVWRDWNNWIGRWNPPERRRNGALEYAIPVSYRSAYRYIVLVVDAVHRRKPTSKWSPQFHKIGQHPMWWSLT